MVDGEKNNNPTKNFRKQYSYYVDKARKNLTRFRKLEGMSQEVVADRLGVLQNYISRIEKGDVDFVIEILFAYRDHFGIDPLLILFDKYDLQKLSNESSPENSRIYQNRIKELLFENTKLLGRIDELRESLDKKDLDFKKSAEKLQLVSEKPPSYNNK